MYKKLLILVACCFGYMLLSAQINTTLTGYWKYKDIVMNGDADELGVELASKFFKDFTLRFSSNSRYESTALGEIETGSWTVNKNEDSLTLWADKGTMSCHHIYFKRKNELTFEMDEKGGLIFTKTNDSIRILPQRKIENLAHATVQLLAKNWLFKNRINPAADAEVSGMMDELFEKITFLHIKINHAYSSSIGSIEISGMWHLEDDNTKLILETEDETRFWLIQSINEKRLELRQGYSNVVYVYEVE